MELIRGLYNWRHDGQGCVATIGNFDGVHKGHQAIFSNLQREAAARSVPAVAISFQPLPGEFFNPDSRSRRLQTLRDRLNCMADCGIDQLLLLRFNKAQARQSADDFIHKALSGTLGVRHLLVGDDFRFGADRAGDLSLLRKAEKDGLFSVADSATVMHEANRISSTRVREALERGDCAVAATLLGRPHRISGRVVYGAQVGRQLGFPTANVALKSHRPLLRGVFAVNAIRADGRQYPAVANLGERPTVDGKKLLLEVHLLDTKADLYGEQLGVDFHLYLRGEKKFDSLDELKAAIHKDADAARQFFKSR